MAIVKMKKMRAIAMCTDRDALLRELMLLGCVELRSQDALREDPEAAEKLTQDHGPVTETQAERQLYREAVGVLDAHVPKKTPLLAPRRSLTRAAVLDESKSGALEQTARELAANRERLKALVSDESRERFRIASLEPWKNSPLPLDHPGTRYAAVTFGTLPLTGDQDALSAGLEDIGAELFEVSRDTAFRYVYLVYLRCDGEQVLKLLREQGFTAPAFGEAKGAAAAGIAEAEKALRDIQAERERIESAISAAAVHRDELERLCDLAETKVDRAEAAGKLLKTERTLLMEGWAPAEREADVTQLLDRFGCAYEFLDPQEEEYGEVPVALKNNKLTDGLNMVTNMYSLPRYGTVDPNPLMAPFFIVFYGIMMADMGYGVLMFLIGLLIMTKKKPKKGFMKYFGELMMEGGVTTFIFGLLTGGLFGDAPLQIARMFNPDTSFQGLPALFNPLDDTIYVLIGAMVLGFIQLNTGMAVSLVQKVKNGQVLDGVLYEVATWIIFLGAALIFLVSSTAGLVVLIIGALMLFAGAMRGKKGIGKFTAIFSTLYNELTGWFGDILSYSRLMALMLAGSVIAQVFNTLGALPRNIIVFILVFLIGHALNFGLNLLGCYVHDLRLQCLEYFGKFYVDGGRPFAPLTMNTKFVDIAED